MEAPGVTVQMPKHLRDKQELHGNQQVSRSEDQPSLQELDADASFRQVLNDPANAILAHINHQLNQSSA
jgi:hypothetical protein